LNKFHASKAREILEANGYSEEVIARVEALLLKQTLKGGGD
jgi:hypothetical protein